MQGCSCTGREDLLPVRLDAAGAAFLSGFNARWSARLGSFRRRAAPPWWGRGLVLTPETRARYEAELPLAEFLSDLGRLAEQVLPHPAWVPTPLRRGRVCLWPDPCGVGSLPDFWADLPDPLAGRVAFAPGELPALFCALADRPRFGSDSARYPAQESRFWDLARAAGEGPFLILDIACGVGFGVLEAAALAREARARQVHAVGVTLEPLEAWMARRRRLPHDPAREERLRRCASRAGDVAFLAADCRRLPVRGPFSIVLCNGLAGGPALHRSEDLVHLLRECGRVLAPGGWLLAANRFHEGCRRTVEAFAEAARGLGWQVSGEWRDLALRKAPGTAAAGP